MFNETHPELRDGEIFVTNTANPEMTNIGWKTKRIGNTAYSINGLIVSGLRPVFRKEDEVFLGI